ncbi:glutamine synthetase family protein [Pseudomonas sp. N040]|uniref:glutamine synthetase family protein n=1 Tax=Pseudomonas sp. N040 TaxID=2785325 RepID=UPI0018A283DC|nr:glutamine synthetase family protein [Pseudomonas sp. N040]MBF7729010.1 glutamine synthetase [Pseudomonas sp. N040]MBW7012650.1 glutamine synthetase family protein [Pseudomonas sp. N040]
MHPHLSSATEALDWLKANDIRRVELVFADLTSVARGKILSAASFAEALGAKAPSLFLGLTVTGGEPEEVFARIFPQTFPDMALRPDWSTLVRDPLAAVPTASIICDIEARFTAADGQHQVDVAQLSPRQLLKRVLERLAAAGYRARVAPELEFFLVHPQRDACGGLQVAHGMSGTVPHIESSHDLASAETAATFAPFFDDLWAACEAQGIPITGYGHESAIGQYEVNFGPGEPLAQADAVFRFKRLAREVARRHGCYATFMAKPYLHEPGTGMHWHISLSDAAGNNPFTAEDGSPHPRLRHFIGGWQASARASIALLAPYAHSYVRLQRPDAAPASVEWGYDNRTVAFRIPHSDPANRRVEHRLPGGDANPYLSLALMLGAGLSGMQQQLEPGPEVSDRPAASARGALPLNLGEALDDLQRCPIMLEVFGAPFIELYNLIKRHELGEQDADPDFALKHLLARS